MNAVLRQTADEILFGEAEPLVPPLPSMPDLECGVRHGWVGQIRIDDLVGDQIQILGPRLEQFVITFLVLLQASLQRLRSVVVGVDRQQAVRISQRIAKQWTGAFGEASDLLRHRKARARSGEREARRAR